MNTPNVETLSTLINMIDYLESSNQHYMTKTQVLHIQMLSIITLADIQTYKYCRIISDNYTNKLLKIEIDRINHTTKEGN